MKPSKFITFLFMLFTIAAVGQANGAIEKRFKDWTAICDDGGNCTSLAVDQRSLPNNKSYRLEVSRSRGNNSFWRLSFFIGGDNARTFEPVHISVDFEEPLTLNPDEDYRAGTRANILNITGISQGNRLLGLFKQGNQAFFNYMNTQGQETSARFSLNGLSATLLWIDDQQQRLGSPRLIGVSQTRTAQKSGAAANSFTSGNTAVAAPDKIPAAVLKLHFADDECEEIDKEPLASFGFETAKLNDKTKLYLVPCYAGAYNIIYRAYTQSLSNDIGPQQLLFANYSNELGWTGTKHLINADYDAKTKTLSAFAKGRGLGDCGSTVEYRWKETAFKMIEYRYWDVCDASRSPEQWPVIFKARPSAN